MRSKKPRTVTMAALLLAVLLLVSVPLSAFAETTPATRIVALGDSITAGYEPDLEAGVSYYGYVDRVYEQALFRGRASVANYGVVGLTSTGLNKLLQAVVAGTEVKGADIQSDLEALKDQTLPVAQIKTDLKAATHVTLTIGLNDIGTDIVERYRELNTDEKLKAFADEKLKTYGDNLQAVLKAVYAVNPKVKVVISDQYFPIPPVLAALAARLQPIKASMDTILQTTVKSFADQQYAIQIAPVAAQFVGKEGNYTHISVLDVNPTQAGYAAIAEQFAKTIWGDYKTVTRVEGLITVVVGGRTLDTPFLPTLINDSTFVPLREYTEALGANVEWVGATNTAVIKLGGNQVELTIDSNVMKINGTTKTIQDLPLFYEIAGETKTYVPLRLMVEGLGLDVQYAGGSHTAYINK